MTPEKCKSLEENREERGGGPERRGRPKGEGRGRSGWNIYRTASRKRKYNP